MKHVDFVHLHVHTSYSLLDGACRVRELTDLAAKMRFPALAVTDHGAMFGVIDFYQSALRSGIKPIIGQEFYVAPGSRTERQPDGYGEVAYHVVLLARDLAGYQNLLKLSSESFQSGFYYKPRIDREILEQNHEGLIALSACLKGEVARRFLKGNEGEAVEAAAWYRDVFQDSYYLEIQHNGLEEQARANAGLAKIGTDLGVPLVATNDVHYLRRDDQRMHDVLLCIQTGKTVNDEDRMRMDAQELYLKSAEEMASHFREFPEALTNTLEVAERCNLEIPLGKTHLPHFPVPDDMTPQACLVREVREGFERRMESILSALAEDEREMVHTKYKTRLAKELETITEMGFAGYFLIVWDFIRYARDQGIPVGPGRGSAAGSLASYSLGITDINPIEYGLLFERFLNPERISLPDIDIDFCMDRRDEVLKYVSGKYGEDRVAQIITFGTMAARGAIRDVGRALDMNYAEVDRIAKMVPDIIGITLSKALEQEPQLREMMKKDKRVAELIELAQKIEGLQRHASTHAAGVVISDRPLNEYVPLFKGSKGEEVLTQYAMGDLEKVGLVKFDFLGLRTLTLLDNALTLANRRLEREGRPAISQEGLPLDDRTTYELLSRGDTDGVFQLESSGMKDLLVKMKPGSFEELIALVALYRPGPLGSGMVTDFINRKQGRQEITYDLPQLKGILEETYGVIVYQEQVIQIASEIAGYSLGEADLLRRAMGKKKPEEMERQLERFMDGAKKRDIPQAKAKKIFDTVVYFAGYGFNKSHSAAYALISYRTAYLKAHFPEEFMAALLTSEMDNSDKVTGHIGVCKEMGIKPLPPDINESEIPFSVVEGGIRFGLGAVKNVGLAALDEILRQRESEGAPFHSLEDFCARVDLRKVNRRVIESLIKSGAFDGFGGHRAQNLAALDGAIERGQKVQKDRANGQISMFDSAMEADPSHLLPEVEPWSEHLRLSYEKDSLGFYISGHPLDKYRADLDRYITTDLGKLGELAEGQEVRVAGIKQSVKEISTKKGDRMAFLTLEDLHGNAELVIFSDVFKESTAILASDQPILVKGVVDSNGEKPKIKVQEIDLLEEYRKKVTEVVQINLSTLGLSRDDLDVLRSILLRHRGDCRVKIRLTIPTKSETIIRVGDDLRVDTSEEMVNEVEGRFGHGSVTFA
ncbi:MAG: DNA polymerase III subunit alpha [bacterium]|nr:MAG: DNA polymerase III subunit alpha [bacterium]